MEGLNWTLVLSNQSKLNLNDFRKKTKERYAAVLNFNGLSSVVYGSLKIKIKNDITTRMDTIPWTIAANIQIADKFINLRTGKYIV